MKRKIIKINEEKCTAAEYVFLIVRKGLCSLSMEKQGLSATCFVTGLGACIKACPTGAMTTEEREAEPYDEYRVMDNVVKGGENVIKAHLVHLKDHGQDEFYNQQLIT